MQAWVLVGVLLLGGVWCDNHGDGEDQVWQECTEAPERGTCTEWVVRWYYNDTLGECSRFWFGGCDEQKKANNFETEEDCSSYCKPNTKGTENIKIGVDDAEVKNSDKTTVYQPASSACGAGKALPSLCTDWKVKWYYDAEKRMCDRFWYGGCEGVANKFDTEEQCQASCMATAEEDVCSQPVVTGRCRANHPRWYYNKDRRECLEFVYGGCDGNGNRFRTRDDCERTCLAGTSALGDEREQCERSQFGCCDDGRTPAKGENKQGCPPKCLQLLYGCCEDGVTPATGYNQEGCENIEISSGTDELCEQSEFGCCPDGTTVATRADKQDCYEDRAGTGVDVPGSAPRDVTLAAVAGDPTAVTLTWQPPDRPNGRIRGYIVFYTNDPNMSDRDWNVEGVIEDRQSITIYSLALDTTYYFKVQARNDNGYGPMSATHAFRTTVTRVTSTTAQCRQPKEMGSCRDNPVVMWYYDAAAGQCARFWYGGCGGNSNRFKSEKECLTTCRNIVDKETTTEELPVCEQPKETGPCRAYLKRWYYNKDSGVCEEFVYGGCSGNRNNFESQASCEQYCRRGTPVSKPGNCPTIVRPANETCTSSCRYDGDCREEEKCCAMSNNCYMCSRPEAEQDPCGQSPSVGPCRADIQRYYYNRDSRQCETFRYGGCGGNRNNFETLEACQRYCRIRVAPTEQPETSRNTNVRQSVCTYAPARGPCERSITKYYYNVATMTCETFNYGGCLGNHNNFETEAKCMQYCGLRQADSYRATCELPKEEGPCRGNYQRWHYDARSGRCFQFTYGGCQGNGNNFADERTCTSTCSVAGPQPVTPRPTAAPPTREEDLCSLQFKGTTQCNNGATSYWYYEKSSGQCREIPSGECNSNRNNFDSREQCERYCDRNAVCQPLTYTSTVRCLALIPRWTYNSRTGSCESFSYGGCGGSANNFESEEACERKCNPRAVEPVTRAPETESRSEICAMPESPGNCLAYMRNWRYDSLTGQCVEFTYGGCGGNKNNFDSREECESFCSRPVVCQAFEEPEVSCLAYYSRWRYDPASRQCENFVYGGCGGNANNFETIEACEQKCITQPEVDNDRNRVETNTNTWRDICNLQADVGPCRQYIRRWHYNAVSQTCEEFTYGGCLGNHNNFESKLQCMTYCDSTKGGGVVIRPVTEAPDEVEGSGEVATTVATPTGVAVCHLESETGPCRAYLRLWFYNHLAGACQEFVYGGCRGNENRFNTQEECEAQCSPREVCLLPQQSGNCMSYIRRWFFDYNEQKCKEFAFGGCDGNANNFDTQESCETRCEPLMRETVPGPSVIDKSGYCPARTDWQGLLGACAPQCKDDNGCPSNLKCCHHGCGYKCVAAVAEEPYQMDAPMRLSANTVSKDAVHVTWYDPGLDRDQLIRDNRYYTIRYHSYSLGQYNYMNVTDLRGHVNGLRENTEYEFAVRVNNPPYLSEWSDMAKNKTRQILVTKAGVCPVVEDHQVGICLEECQSDGDCPGVRKCCRNGCGKTCINPQGYDICSLPTDTGKCANWEVRWYYNNEKQMCDRFWYGGCNDGNENNFKTEVECKSRCAGAPSPPETTPAPYTCFRSLFGCCADGYTTATDENKSNCPENRRDRETIVPATPGESVIIDCRYGANVTWYRDGKLVVTNERLRINSDGKIEVYSATIEDDGVYACHVGDVYNRPTIYRYVLQVRVPIGILPGPDRIMVKPGRQAFLHCEVYGNPKPTISWQRFGSTMQASRDHETFNNGTLLIHSAKEADQGQYTCVADNGVSQPATRTIELLLREMLVARIENDNGRVMEGSHITITCEGRGYPAPTITWEKKGQPLTTNGNVYISDTGRLVIRESRLDDSGVYTCIVANNMEKIETSTSVQVVPKSMPDDKCEDKTSLMKCRLIVTARLCGYTMYSKICCDSCHKFYVNGE